MKKKKKKKLVGFFLNNFGYFLLPIKVMHIRPIIDHLPH